MCNIQYNNKNDIFISWILASPSESVGWCPAYRRLVSDVSEVGLSGLTESGGQFTHMEGLVVWGRPSRGLACFSL